jgi:hypothetical protein
MGRRHNQYAQPTKKTGDFRRSFILSYFGCRRADQVSLKGMSLPA